MNLNGSTVKLKKHNTSVYTDISNIFVLENNTEVSSCKSKTITYYPKSKDSIYTLTSETLTEKEIFNNEIMLRHMTKDEALAELDKFIQKAIITKASSVRIIHGKNGTVLKSAVINYLEHNEFISHFGFAPFNSGGFGVTVAYFNY